VEEEDFFGFRVYRESWIGIGKKKRGKFPLQTTPDFGAPENIPLLSVLLSLLSISDNRATAAGLSKIQIDRIVTT
jgi:hypothetical protein